MRPYLTYAAMICHLESPTSTVVEQPVRSVRKTSFPLKQRSRENPHLGSYKRHAYPVRRCLEYEAFNNLYGFEGGWALVNEVPIEHSRSWPKWA